MIYRYPTSSIRLGGGVSLPFRLYRGTRQGCPFSLALFALAIEAVVEALCTSPRIRGIRIGLLEERVALYEDDMLLFLNNAGPSLQGALQVLDSFATFTGLKVNWSKSLLLPIDQAAKTTTPPDTPLQWVDTFKYLEVLISSQASDFLSLNLVTVLLEVKANLKA